MAVVQHAVVDHLAEDGAKLRAEGAAAQAAEHDTDDGADTRAHRAGRHTQAQACATASKCSCDPAGGADEPSEGAA